MDCRESISSIPDYFFSESDEKTKQNKTKPTAFTTICASSSKALNGGKVKTFTSEFSL